MGSCHSSNSVENIVEPLGFDGIQLICKSWKKTYSNLFDYTAASDSLELQILKIENSVRIFKGDGLYKKVPYEDNQKFEQVEKGFKELEAIIDILLSKNKSASSQQEKNSTQYRLVGKNEKSRNQLWIVIKTLPSKKYTLKEGDIIKVGKQKIRVKEIITKTEDQKEPEEIINTKFKIYNTLTKESTGFDVAESQACNYTCRICLQEGENSNPLIVTCNCSGSAKYIHLKCIQLWLTKSINPHPVNMSTVITWKPLVCELCSKSIPFKIYLDGKKYFTVNIPRPEKPYLVLNPIFKEKEEKKSKIYYLVSFGKKKEMIIGRKKDSDILVSEDSSVSRHHSIIKFTLTPGKNQGKFTLEDNESKFGTLVMLKRQVQLKKQLNSICFQLGGDVIEMKMGYRNQIKCQSTLNQTDLINKSQSDSSQDYEEEEQENNANEPQHQNQQNAAEGQRQVFA